MPAIVTDNFKIENCSNFIDKISSTDTSTDNNYYVFIGYPNSNIYWDSNPESPVDNVTYHNSYKESILGVKKLTSSNVIRVIPRIDWENGVRYDMYRHDYSVYNQAKITGSSRLYDSNFYVMNSEYRVYMCLSNGASIDNEFKGVPSTIEPVHTDPNDYSDKGDGYVWKYLYTISPGDFLKFDSTKYISVPNNWQQTSNSSIKNVIDTAIDGGIISVLIEKKAQYLVGSDPEQGINCQIKGDGFNASALVIFDDEGYPISVQVTNSGSGYTYGTLDLDSVVSPAVEGERAIFNVIIPPIGGYGKNIYNDLGAFRCLVYARIENEENNPDFIVGNQFARVGIVKNVSAYGTSGLFNSSTGSGVYALAIDGTGLGISLDGEISQSSTGAKGIIVSAEEIGAVTFIKYIQPRENYVDNYVNVDQGITGTFDPFIVNPDYTGIQTALSYNFSEFDTSAVTISGSTYNIVSINGSTYSGKFLGQTFTNGISKPDINTKSGDILYVDNRSTITRQIDQREDIKVIIEF